MNGLRLGKPCYAFHEIPSTMDVAHRLALQETSEGTCVWAERQTGGRGRAGRHWSSPPGGIYCSVVLRPTRSQQELPQLALVAGLATVQAIHDVTGLPAAIRWPNDVLLHGKKLAGILTEARSSSSTQHTAHSTRTYAVIGMGINVITDSRDLPEGTTALAHWTQKVPGTFLHQVPGTFRRKVPGTFYRRNRTERVQRVDRFALAAALFRRLEQAYQQWNADGFAAIRPLLLPWIGLFGQLVHITTTRERFEGQAMDIDETGRLLVRLDSGMVRAFDAGDVTLLRESP